MYRRGRGRGNQGSGGWGGGGGGQRGRPNYNDDQNEQIQLQQMQNMVQYQLLLQMQNVQDLALLHAVAETPRQRLRQQNPHEMRQSPLGVPPFRRAPGMTRPQRPAEPGRSIPSLLSAAFSTSQMSRPHSIEQARHRGSTSSPTRDRPVDYSRGRRDSSLPSRDRMRNDEVRTSRDGRPNEFNSERPEQQKHSHTVSVPSSKSVPVSTASGFPVKLGESVVAMSGDSVIEMNVGNFTMSQDHALSTARDSVVATSRVSVVATSVGNVVAKCGNNVVVASGANAACSAVTSVGTISVTSHTAASNVSISCAPSMTGVRHVTSSSGVTTPAITCTSIAASIPNFTSSFSVTSLADFVIPVAVSAGTDVVGSVSISSSYKVCDLDIEEFVVLDEIEDEAPTVSNVMMTASDESHSSAITRTSHLPAVSIAASLDSNTRTTSAVNDIVVSPTATSAKFSVTALTSQTLAKISTCATEVSANIPVSKLTQSVTVSLSDPVNVSATVCSLTSTSHRTIGVSPFVTLTEAVTSEKTPVSTNQFAQSTSVGFAHKATLPRNDFGKDDSGAMASDGAIRPNTLASTNTVIVKSGDAAIMVTSTDLATDTAVVVSGSVTGTAAATVALTSAIITKTISSVTVDRTAAAVTVTKAAAATAAPETIVITPAAVSSLVAITVAKTTLSTQATTLATNTTMSTIVTPSATNSETALIVATASVTKTTVVTPVTASATKTTVATPVIVSVTKTTLVTPEVVAATKATVVTPVAASTCKTTVVTPAVTKTTVATPVEASTCKTTVATPVIVSVTKTTVVTPAVTKTTVVTPVVVAVTKATVVTPVEASITKTTVVTPVEASITKTTVVTPVVVAVTKATVVTQVPVAVTNTPTATPVTACVTETTMMTPMTASIAKTTVVTPVTVSVTKITVVTPEVVTNTPMTTPATASVTMTTVVTPTTASVTSTTLATPVAVTKTTVATPVAVAVPLTTVVTPVTGSVTKTTVVTPAITKTTVVTPVVAAVSETTVVTPVAASTIKTTVATTVAVAVTMATVATPVEASITKTTVVTPAATNTTVAKPIEASITKATVVTPVAAAATKATVVTPVAAPASMTTVTTPVTITKTTVVTQAVVALTTATVVTPVATSTFKTTMATPVSVAVTNTPPATPVRASVTKTTVVTPVAASTTKTTAVAVPVSMATVATPVPVAVTKTTVAVPVTASVTKATVETPVVVAVTKTTVVTPVTASVTKTTVATPVAVAVTKTIVATPVTASVTKTTVATAVAVTKATVATPVSVTNTAMTTPATASLTMTTVVTPTTASVTSATLATPVAVTKTTVATPVAVAVPLTTVVTTVAVAVTKTTVVTPVTGSVTKTTVATPVLVAVTKTIVAAPVTAVVAKSMALTPVAAVITTSTSTTAAAVAKTMPAIPVTAGVTKTNLEPAAISSPVTQINQSSPVKAAVTMATVSTPSTSTVTKRIALTPAAYTVIKPTASTPATVVKTIASATTVTQAITVGAATIAVAKLVPPAVVSGNNTMTTAAVAAKCTSIQLTVGSEPVTTPAAFASILVKPTAVAPAVATRLTTPVNTSRSFNPLDPAAARRAFLEKAAAVSQQKIGMIVVTREEKKEIVRSMSSTIADSCKVSVSSLPSAITTPETSCSGTGITTVIRSALMTQRTSCSLAGITIAVTPSAGGTVQPSVWSSAWSKSAGLVSKAIETVSKVTGTGSMAANATSTAVGVPITTAGVISSTAGIISSTPNAIAAASQPSVLSVGTGVICSTSNANSVAAVISNAVGVISSAPNTGATIVSTATGVVSAAAATVSKATSGVINTAAPTVITTARVIKPMGEKIALGAASGVAKQLRCEDQTSQFLQNLLAKQKAELAARNASESAETNLSKATEMKNLVIGQPLVGGVQKSELERTTTLGNQSIKEATVLKLPGIKTATASTMLTIPGVIQTTAATVYTVTSVKDVTPATAMSITSTDKVTTTATSALPSVDATDKVSTPAARSIEATSATTTSAVWSANTAMATAVSSIPSVKATTKQPGLPATGATTGLGLTATIVTSSITVLSVRKTTAVTVMRMQGVKTTPTVAAFEATSLANVTAKSIMQNVTSTLPIAGSVTPASTLSHDSKSKETKLTTLVSSLSNAKASTAVATSAIAKAATAVTTSTIRTAKESAAVAESAIQRETILTTKETTDIHTKAFVTSATSVTAKTSAATTSSSVKSISGSSHGVASSFLGSATTPMGFKATVTGIKATSGSVPAVAMQTGSKLTGSAALSGLSMITQMYTQSSKDDDDVATRGSPVKSTVAATSSPLGVVYSTSLSTSSVIKSTSVAASVTASARKPSSVPGSVSPSLPKSVNSTAVTTFTSPTVKTSGSLNSRKSASMTELSSTSVTTSSTAVKPVMSPIATKSSAITTTAAPCCMKLASVTELSAPCVTKADFTSAQTVKSSIIASLSLSTSTSLTVSSSLRVSSSTAVFMSPSSNALQSTSSAMLNTMSMIKASTTTTMACRNVEPTVSQSVEKAIRLAKLTSQSSTIYSDAVIASTQSIAKSTNIASCKSADNMKTNTTASSVQSATTMAAANAVKAADMSNVTEDSSKHSSEILGINKRAADVILTNKTKHRPVSRIDLDDVIAANQPPTCQSFLQSSEADDIIAANNRLSQDSFDLNAGDEQRGGHNRRFRGRKRRNDANADAVPSKVPSTGRAHLHDTVRKQLESLPASEKDSFSAGGDRVFNAHHYNERGSHFRKDIRRRDIRPVDDNGNYKYDNSDRLRERLKSRCQLRGLSLRVMKDQRRRDRVDLLDDVMMGEINELDVVLGAVVTEEGKKGWRWGEVGGHLGELTMDTQLESCRYDCATLTKLYITASRDWVRLKPLQKLLYDLIQSPTQKAFMQHLEAVRTDKQFRLTPSRVTRRTYAACRADFKKSIKRIMDIEEDYMRYMEEQHQMAIDTTTGCIYAQVIDNMMSVFRNASVKVIEDESERSTHRRSESRGHEAVSTVSIETETRSRVINSRSIEVKTQSREAETASKLTRSRLSKTKETVTKSGSGDASKVSVETGSHTTEIGLQAMETGSHATEPGSRNADEGVTSSTEVTCHRRVNSSSILGEISTSGDVSRETGLSQEAENSSLALLSSDILDETLKVKVIEAKIAGRGVRKKSVKEQQPAVNKEPDPVNKNDDLLSALDTVDIGSTTQAGTVPVVPEKVICVEGQVKPATVRNVGCCIGSSSSSGTEEAMKDRIKTAENINVVGKNTSGNFVLKSEMITSLGSAQVEEHMKGGKGEGARSVDLILKHVGGASSDKGVVYDPFDSFDESCLDPLTPVITEPSVKPSSTAEPSITVNLTTTTKPSITGRPGTTTEHSITVAPSSITQSSITVKSSSTIEPNITTKPTITMQNTSVATVTFSAAVTSKAALNQLSPLPAAATVATTAADTPDISKMPFSNAALSVVQRHSKPASGAADKDVVALPVSVSTKRPTPDGDEVPAIKKKKMKKDKKRKHGDNNDKDRDQTSERKRRRNDEDNDNKDVGVDMVDKHGMKKRIFDKPALGTRVLHPHSALLTYTPPSPNIFTDSFLSQTFDPYSSTPLPNFSSEFNPFLPPSTTPRSTNPYLLSPSPLSCFVLNADVEFLRAYLFPARSALTPHGALEMEAGTPKCLFSEYDIRKSGISESFLWALGLSAADVKKLSRFDDAAKDTAINAVGKAETAEESRAESGGVKVSGDGLEVEGGAEDASALSASLSTSVESVCRKFEKGNNPLMNAFRQVVEAKRRAADQQKQQQQEKEKSSKNADIFDADFAPSRNKRTKANAAATIEKTYDEMDSFIYQAQVKLNAVLVRDFIKEDVPCTTSVITPPLTAGPIRAYRHLTSMSKIGLRQFQESEIKLAALPDVIRIAPRATQPIAAPSVYAPTLPSTSLATQPMTERSLTVSPATATIAFVSDAAQAVASSSVSIWPSTTPSTTAQVGTSTVSEQRTAAISASVKAVISSSVGPSKVVTTTVGSVNLPSSTGLYGSLPAVATTLTMETNKSAVAVTTSISTIVSISSTSGTVNVNSKSIAGNVNSASTSIIAKTPAVLLTSIATADHTTVPPPNQPAATITASQVRAGAVIATNQIAATTTAISQTLVASSDPVVTISTVLGIKKSTATTLNISNPPGFRTPQTSPSITRSNPNNFTMAMAPASGLVIRHATMTAKDLQKPSTAAKTIGTVVATLAKTTSGGNSSLRFSAISSRVGIGPSLPSTFLSTIGVSSPAVAAVSVTAVYASTATATVTLATAATNPALRSSQTSSTTPSILSILSSLSPFSSSSGVTQSLTLPTASVSYSSNYPASHAGTVVAPIGPCGGSTGTSNIDSSPSVTSVPSMCPPPLPPIGLASISSTDYYTGVWATDSNQYGGYYAAQGTASNNAQMYQYPTSFGQYGYTPGTVETPGANYWQTSENISYGLPTHSYASTLQSSVNSAAAQYYSSAYSQAGYAQIGSSNHNPAPVTPAVVQIRSQAPLEVYFTSRTSSAPNTAPTVPSIVTTAASNLPTTQIFTATVAMSQSVSVAATASVAKKNDKTTMGSSLPAIGRFLGLWGGGSQVEAEATEGQVSQITPASMSNESSVEQSPEFGSAARHVYGGGFGPRPGESMYGGVPGSSITNPVYGYESGTGFYMQEGYCVPDGGNSMYGGNRQSEQPFSQFSATGIQGYAEHSGASYGLPAPGHNPQGLLQGAHPATSAHQMRSSDLYDPWLSDSELALPSSAAGPTLPPNGSSDFFSPSGPGSYTGEFAQWTAHRSTEQSPTFRPNEPSARPPGEGPQFRPREEGLQFRMPEDRHQGDVPQFRHRLEDHQFRPPGDRQIFGPRGNGPQFRAPGDQPTFRPNEGAQYGPHSEGPQYRPRSEGPQFTPLGEGPQFRHRLPLDGPTFKPSVQSADSSHTDCSAGQRGPEELPQGSRHSSQLNGSEIRSFGPGLTGSRGSTNQPLYLGLGSGPSRGPMELRFLSSSPQLIGQGSSLRAMESGHLPGSILQQSARLGPSDPRATLRPTGPGQTMPILRAGVRSLFELPVAGLKDANVIAKKQLRVFVFNRDNPVCKDIEKFIDVRGFTRRFDPLNITSLRPIPNLECHVLIHRDDTTRLHHIPNLLALKRDLRVCFLVYENLDDIKSQRLKSIFPRAGLVIMDEATVMSTESDVFEAMCAFMLKQQEEKNSEWKIAIPASIMTSINQYISDNRDRIDVVVRMKSLINILTTFKSRSIIQPIPKGPRSMAEYLRCCVTLQSNFADKHRHFIFVTDGPRGVSDVDSFTRCGIDVLYVVDFMRMFCSKTITKVYPLGTFHKHIAKPTTQKFVDSPLSTATDTFKITS